MNFVSRVIRSVVGNSAIKGNALKTATGFINGELGDPREVIDSLPERPSPEKRYGIENKLKDIANSGNNSKNADGSAKVEDFGSDGRKQWSSKKTREWMDANGYKSSQGGNLQATNLSPDQKSSYANLVKQGKSENNEKTR